MVVSVSPGDVFGRILRNARFIASYMSASTRLTRPGWFTLCIAIFAVLFVVIDSHRRSMSAMGQPTPTACQASITKKRGDAGGGARRRGRGGKHETRVSQNQ